MTEKQLINDLIDKTSFNGYFLSKLLKSDKRAYNRRSFDDLFKYYKKFKVTEKILLKALIKAKMGARVCPSAKKLMFCRVKFYAPEYKYRASKFNDSFAYSEYKDIYIENSKYNISYMDKLYDKIKKEL